MGCIGSCGGVNTAQRQMTTQIALGFCALVLSICLGLGVSLGQCKYAIIFKSICIVLGVGQWINTPHEQNQYYSVFCRITIRLYLWSVFFLKYTHVVEVPVGRAADRSHPVFHLLPSICAQHQVAEWSDDLEGINERKSDSNCSWPHRTQNVGKMETYCRSYKSKRKELLFTFICIYFIFTDIPESLYIFSVSSIY